MKSGRFIKFCDVAADFSNRAGFSVRASELKQSPDKIVTCKFLDEIAPTKQTDK